jgi:hypothetical protein
MDRIWLRRSLVAQVVLAVYFQAFTWFPIGSLNDQGGVHNRPLIEELKGGAVTWGDAASAFVFVLPGVLFLIGYMRQFRPLLWLCLLVYGVWLALQVQGWWVAYIFGASESWQRVYNRVFGKTLKMLPSWSNHLAPDAMHFTMQLLLVAVVVCGVLGLVRREPVNKKRAANSV